MKRVVIDFKEDSSLEGLLIAMKKLEDVPFIEVVRYDFDDTFKIDYTKQVSTNNEPSKLLD